MAIKFSDTKGKAIKTSVESYAYADGDNKLRIFGDVLPRYMYWVKGTNDKDIPVECLAFNRDKEKFDNLDKDHVPSYYPAIKCSWSYSVNCIDPRDGKAKVLNLKKKLFEQILDLASDLGDPTDPVLGWDICFKKQKTGPLAFNVEYTLQQRKCANRALTEEELEVISKEPSIDTKYPRPTEAEVKGLLDKLAAGNVTENTSTAEAEAVNELDS